MRRILVDLARRKGADKRGGGITPVPLDENDLSFERSDDLIRLDDALDALVRGRNRGFEEKRDRRGALIRPIEPSEYFSLQTMNHVTNSFVRTP